MKSILCASIIFMCIVSALQAQSDDSLSSSLALRERVPAQGWFGASYGHNNLGLTLGIRYDFLGFGASIIDLHHFDSDAPEYIDAEIPHSNYTEHNFPGARIGVDLYGFLEPLEWFSLYGSVGLYLRETTRLRRSTATGDYWAAPGTTYEDLQLNLGAGLQFILPAGLVLGGGYATVNNWGAHIGYFDYTNKE